MNRRKFLKGMAAMGGAGLLAGVYAWQIEPFWLEFVELPMPVKNLPEAWVGKKLMQISDIHTGPRVDHQFLIKSLKEAASYEPDIVLYTGDYISLDNNDAVMKAELNEVLQHFVKGKKLTLAVLGNHDYGVKWSQPEVADYVVNALNKVEIRVLRNEQVEVEGIQFIGVDDFWAEKHDLKVALKAYDVSKAAITLCHNPDVCDLEGWGNYQGWILSGHTHGGQCKPPFLAPPLLPVANKLYSSGLIALNDGRQLYINRALGHLLQVRFNVRPEITVFTLERA